MACRASQQIDLEPELRAKAADLIAHMAELPGTHGITRETPAPAATKLQVADPTIVSKRIWA